MTATLTEATMIDAAAWRRVAALLGLGVRGRLVVVGVEQVRRENVLALAIVADDASPNSRKKVDGVLRARGVRVIGGVTAATLGAAVGRETTAVVGVVDRALAGGIIEHVTSGTPTGEEERA